MFLSSHAILKSISIHAPAKGATKWIAKNPEAYAFQSTLPRRERRCIYPLVIYCSLFQSTLPRRERRQRKEESRWVWRISIHAPAKGATPCGIGWYYKPVRFQSTLPRRERLCRLGPRILCSRFQSTLPRRERRDRTGLITSIAKFQSTLPRRERP